SASMKQGDSPFQLPGTDDLRGVTFEAFVGSQVRLRARVSYTDTDGGVILPGYRVRVRDWVVVR
ncbi:MAG TPA: hypothetical protein VMN58_07580, partial [Acidimicrobiales bacterium]|nr:hypothetical protein [Acidimicrobiales bacterium]